MYFGYCTIQLWCCVSFFGIFVVVARKWFWQEIVSYFVVVGKFYYNRKKKFQSSVWRVVLLCQFLVLAIATGKSYSRLSGGLCCCVSFWFWRLGPKKKVTVVCLADCAVVSGFGSGDYDQKKKSYSPLSGGLCCCVSFW